jgi:cobalt-zinc-cadmium efflux system membrane fusion protein
MNARKPIWWKITSQKNYLKVESEYRRAKGMYESLRGKLQLLEYQSFQRGASGKLTAHIHFLPDAWR